MYRLNYNILVVSTFYLCLLVVLVVQASAGNIVRDQLGRQVEVPGDIERIIPLAPSIAEYVYLLGKWDKVVGITRFTDFPPGIKDLPRIGSYVNLDLEKIVRLRPDLCLATKDGNPRDVVRELEQLGIPVYALDPRDMDAIEQTLLKLGQLLDSEDRAREVVQNMQEQLSGIKGLVRQSASRPKVFFQIGISPIVSAGENSIVNQLIEIAGGNNAVDSKKPYPRYSREDILKMKPDIIVVSSMTNQEEKFEQVRKMWSEFESIPAVSSGRIYSVKSDLVNRASPRIIKGLRLLFKIFHPDLAEELPQNSAFLNKIE